MKCRFVDGLLCFCFQIQCFADRHDCCDVYVDMFQKRLSERVILKVLIKVLSKLF